MQLNTWLEVNKITDSVRAMFNVHMSDDRIVFPVHDTNGQFLFNKYRRSPSSNIGAKYTYDVGGKVTLYGYNHAKDSSTILITEGEKDCLVAWSHNIPAVTSTGGAMSFQSEWVDLFIHDEDKDTIAYKDVIICLDNDEAGATGMVKILKVLPWAKVLLLPDRPNMKDISDYVNAGGDLHELLKTAKGYADIAEVTEDRLKRVARMQSVFFHDAYIKAHTKVNIYTGERKTFDSDKVTHAKGYPLPNIIDFDTHGKAKCEWHKDDDTPSLQYYSKTNTAYCFACAKVVDSIEAYRHKNNCSFKEAVDNLNKI